MLLETETEVVTIFGKTWGLHVFDVLRTTLDENAAMIYDTVSYLKENGREVVYDAEHFFDGYRTDSAYAICTLEAAEKAGANCIVLCDTNGGAMPWDVERIIGEVREAGITAPLGIHTHNDSEWAWPMRWRLCGWRCACARHHQRLWRALWQQQPA